MFIILPDSITLLLQQPLSHNCPPPSTPHTGLSLSVLDSLWCNMYMWGLGDYSVVVNKVHLPKIYNQNIMVGIG